MMPCCRLKDAPSVTVGAHLPQKQQTMLTETIVALVQKKGTWRSANMAQ